MVRQWQQRPAKAGQLRLRLETLEDRVVPVAVIFDLLPDVSPLTLSGNVGGSPIMAQGAGSLITRLSGQITTDVNLQALTHSWSRNGTSATLANSGSWQPLANGAPGSAPANYGGRVNFLGEAVAAVRNTTVTAFTSSPMALAGGDGVYLFSSSQTLVITGGAAAYNHPLFPPGSVNLPLDARPNMGSEGLLIDIGFFDPQAAGLFLLYAPVSITLVVNIGGIVDATLNIRGEIIALGIAADGFAGGGFGNRFADPALADLASMQTEVSPLVPTNTSLREGEAPFQLDVGVQGLVDEAIAPVVAPAQEQAATDQLFAEVLWQFGAAV